MKSLTVSNDECSVNTCTSCQLCAAVCPINAIEIHLNANGFYRPSVEGSKCINCGNCIKNCYKFDSNVSMKSEYQQAWSCKAAKKQILENTTSGGVAYLLARIAAEEDYAVFGVAYDSEKNRAIAKIAKENIEQFSGSKYIQAYTADAFDELLQNCKNKNVLIFGLPCQIYAIDKFSREKNFRDKLILVDLFCHGCPSMLLWDANLKHVQEKLGETTFDKVEFRSKKRGWHEFCETFRKDDKEYIAYGENSFFYQLFFSNQLLNDACGDCKLRGTLAYCDIRLGDFWGNYYDEDKEGVSAVVAVTEKGKEFLGKLPSEIFIKEHSLEDICKFQSYDNKYVINNRIRSELLDLLKNGSPIESVAKRYKKALPLKDKIKRFVKKCFSLLPQSLRFKIKKIIHS